LTVTTALKLIYCVIDFAASGQFYRQFLPNISHIRTEPRINLVLFNRAFVIALGRKGKPKTVMGPLIIRFNF